MQLLRNQPSPGKVADLNEGQVLQFEAIAYENSSARGRPISHWSPGEVRDLNQQVTGCSLFFGRAGDQLIPRVFKVY